MHFVKIAGEPEYSATTAGASEGVTNVQEESKRSEYEDFIDDVHPCRAPPAASAKCIGTISDPKCKPNYLLSEWEVSESAMRRTLIDIWLPSEVAKGEYSYNFGNCSSVHVIPVQWPRLLTDTLYLHELWS